MSHNDHDEHCPFCKNHLNPGATVCAHCGAFLMTNARARGKSQLMATSIVVWLAMVLFLGNGLLNHFDMKTLGWFAVMFFGGGTLLAYWINWGLTKSWYRRT